MLLEISQPFVIINIKILGHGPFYCCLEVINTKDLIDTPNLNKLSVAVVLSLE